MKKKENANEMVSLKTDLFFRQPITLYLEVHNPYS